MSIELRFLLLLRGLSGIEGINALHFGQNALPVDRICSSADSLLQEFLESQDEESVPPRPPSL